MRRLLDLAEWVCGADARRTVFEPLVADWQRELSEARHHGAWRFVSRFGSGTAAYAASLARCALMSSGWLPTWRAALTAVLAVAVSTMFASALLLLMSSIWGPQVQGAAWPPLDLGSIQTQGFLLYSAVIVSPPALLPALFLMRRDARSSVRHAIVISALAAAGTTALVVWTSPAALNAYFSTFEASEREHARVVANDRAGRYQYPGSAVRFLRGETTVEQRRESFRRFEAFRAEQLAKRPPRVETWRQWWYRYQPVALAILFAVMGWTLGGLGVPSLSRALLWWGLVLVAMLTLTATPGLFLRHVVPRFPYWTTVPIFTVVTMLLVVTSWRQRQAPAPTP